MYIRTIGPWIFWQVNLPQGNGVMMDLAGWTTHRLLTVWETTLSCNVLTEIWDDGWWWMMMDDDGWWWMMMDDDGWCSSSSGGVYSEPHTLQSIWILLVGPKSLWFWTGWIGESWILGNYGMSQICRGQQPLSARLPVFTIDSNGCMPSWCWNSNLEIWWWSHSTWTNNCYCFPVFLGSVRCFLFEYNVVLFCMEGWEHTKWGFTLPIWTASINSRFASQRVILYIIFNI